MERRPKKRPSFGVRTVELNRGQDGFGFTLQGQGPCKLSSIVENSPAFKARLKPGDHVIAVNSQNVSKISHDDVVSMIGNSTGLLKLQIAENYCRYVFTYFFRQIVLVISLETYCNLTNFCHVNITCQFSFFYSAGF